VGRDETNVYDADNPYQAIQISPKLSVDPPFDLTRAFKVALKKVSLKAGDGCMKKIIPTERLLRMLADEL
jgi:hypothetical protein